MEDDDKREELDVRVDDVWVLAGGELAVVTGVHHGAERALAERALFETHEGLSTKYFRTGTWEYCGHYREFDFDELLERNSGLAYV